MKVLGIESTAHTFGIGVVDENRKIVLDLRESYKPKEGIIPAEAAQFHKEVSVKLLRELEKGIHLSEIDLIGVASGPGLSPCLNVGVNFSKKLSERIKKPVIGINHCQAHIEIGKSLTGMKDPIILYVSGGNSQIIYYNNGYRVLGETQDIGIGNAIDKLGRNLGLGFPAGPKVEELAKKGNFILLPYSVKGMDLNFSGLLTEAIKRAKDSKLEDVLHSFQEVSFAMLTEVTERALAATEKKELLLVGGVAQNKRLQEMLKTMCGERGAKFDVVPKEYAGDNGTMIALTALTNYREGKFEENMDIRPNWRIDNI